MTKEEKLKIIAQKITSCRKCLLYKTAKKAVPGKGNFLSKIVLIGEAPGYWEDQKGEPFIGLAGKFLDELLFSANLKREDVFITNIIKHRPPANRDPLPEEIKACEPFLDEQLKIIDPKIIVTLGRFSLNKFLPGRLISQIHGQFKIIFWENKKRILVSFYHPAAGLRNGKIKKDLKKDFLKLGVFLNKQISLIN